VVLVSDMQQGSRIEPLQGYEWPSGVLVDVQSVTLADPTNAGLYLVENGPDVETTDQQLRIRVSNEADSTREQLSLAWANKDGPLAKSDPVQVYVPPGQNRIVRVAWPAKGEAADRLVLAGDGHDFDNTLYLIPPGQEQLRLLFVGDDAPDDTKGLLYFLQEALAETPRRKVEVVTRGSKQPMTSTDLLEAQLVVVAMTLPDEQTTLLRKFIEGGGTVLVVLNDSEAAPGLTQLMGGESLVVEEATGRKFALIGRVKFDHPLFAPFADPRFADFTKIHFWKHRRVKLPAQNTMAVLASFDNGDPFLIEQAIGKGRLFVATSGWRPADSQLALSTKFVPILGGMFPRAVGGMEKTQRHVFEKVELSIPGASGRRVVRRPDGGEQELAADSKSFESTDEPGIYYFVLGSEENHLAFNLAADESRTAPLAVEELEHRGARVGTQPTVEQLAERQRQARIVELENRQKMWRWLIVAVLAILLVETALAGRLAHRTLQPQVST
jgi:hypothetical protein